MGSASRFKVMTLTDAAAERVREMMESADQPAVALRVGVKNGGCAGMSYKMDIAEPEQGDEVIDFDGGRVIVDAKANNRIKATIISASVGVGAGGGAGIGASIGLSLARNYVLVVKRENENRSSSIRKFASARTDHPRWHLDASNAKRVGIRCDQRRIVPL